MRTLLDAAPTSRVGRYPKHPFRFNSLVYTAQPFMLAPVLPGETLENLYFEARVITDPIKNPIIGWKKEFYFFYVRVTDLLSDTIRDMFIDPTNTDLGGSLGIAASTSQYYTAKGGIDYMERALKRVVEEYFRDEGETYSGPSDAFLVNSTPNQRPVVQVREQLWMDSLTDKDDMPAGADPGTVSTSGDLEALQMAFNQLQALGMANMTYEDFIRSYGIAIPQKDENKPELLARFTDFQYPSNTIDPTDGSPSSAVSWVFKNGNKERKFFKEPGFVLGVSVTRPKVYFGGIAGNLSAHLTRAWDWMPNYLWGEDNQAMTTLKKFASGTGPLGDWSTNEDAYWVDMRDLFVHGDQYQNVRAWADGTNPSAAYDDNVISLPASEQTIANRKYPSVTDITGLFVNSGSPFVKADGYCSLNVKGYVQDFTQAHIASA